MLQKWLLVSHTDDFWWSPLVIISTASLLLITLMFMWVHRRRNFPACSQTGYLATLGILSSKQAPWWILHESRQHGGVYRLNLLVPFVHTVVVGDARVARTILQDPQVKPWLVYSGFNRVLGGWNIVTRNGSTWHAARKGAVPAFHKRNLERVNEIVVEQLKAWMTDKLAKDDSEFVEFDVAEEMVALTTRSIAEGALEYEMTCDEIELFQHDLEIVLIEYLRNQVGNPLRLVFGSLIPEVRKAGQAAQRLMDLAKRALDSYREKITKIRTNYGSQKYKSLIQCIDENPHYPTDAERHSDILTFLVAGHDTTAYTVAWTLLEIARHQPIQHRLRQELEQTSSLNDCDLLHSVIFESMRLYPVAAMGAVRSVTRRIQVPPHGYYIPKGSTVFVHLLSIHRNPLYWDRPDDFLPERWLNDDGHLKRTNEAFFPFALGSRNCIGQGLATRTIKTMVATIVRHWELSIAESQREVKMDHF